MSSAALRACGLRHCNNNKNINICRLSTTTATTTTTTTNSHPHAHSHSHSHSHPHMRTHPWSITIDNTSTTTNNNNNYNNINNRESFLKSMWSMWKNKTISTTASSATTTAAAASTITSTSNVFSFGHPSSGGPLIDPYTTTTHTTATTCHIQLAGEQARQTLCPVMGNVVCKDIYGEQFSDECLPF